MIFINVKNAPGLQKAHRIWIKRMKHFVDDRYVRDQDFILKLLFCSEVVCLPVHFFWLAAIRKILGLRTVGVFHGFANIQHYSFIRYHFLKIAQWITWKTTSLHIYNSKFTFETLMQQFRSEKKQNDFVIYPAHKSYCFSKDINAKGDNILYFGRMVTAKNVHLIIENFRNSEIKDSYKLILAGGFMDKAIARELHNLKNNAQIQYIGGYDDHLSLRDKLKQIGCDGGFFVSWNTQEPFGLVYQEAIELNLLPLLPMQIGFTEILDERLTEKLTFKSLESAFSAISKTKSTFKVIECDKPLADDIKKFIDCTVDDLGFL